MSDQLVLERLERVEETLQRLVVQRTMKDWYTTDEVAQILDRAAYTVREWCRFGRIRAEKRRTGRGRSKEWIISKDELLRFQNEGLLEN